MTDIQTLITGATAADSSPLERQDAFREIVARFQDLAYGCAFAVLRDFWLAEEVSQEAFITAWQKLHQLREPAAFPGWFKRIVLTECNRLIRGKKLQFVPLDQVLATASPARAASVSHPLDASSVNATATESVFHARRVDFDVWVADSDPYLIAEQNELREKVREAIAALPEHERLATTLFYINEYSQKEIGAFLEVPVSTVVKRLYSARQRLRKRIIEMFEDDLKRHRPSRDDKFAEEVSARLRPYIGSDWEPISAFVYGLAPDYRQDEDAWLRNRQQFDESRYTRRHYVAEHAESGQILGYGSIEQTIYLPKYRMFLMAEPKWLHAGVGDLLLEQLTKDLVEAGAIMVSHRTYAHQTEAVSFLIERGFVETRRVWDLRLNVPAFDVSAFASVAEEVASRGIAITTFADERGRNADEALHKLHEFLNTVKQDDPERRPFVPLPFESVIHWFRRKYVLPDACFIAKQGGRYIGFTDLNQIEPIPQGIMHGFTGVAREHRRQGVATALKLRAIAYAGQRGYRTIRAYNLPSQPEAMALDEKLGFRRAFCYVTVEKFVKEIAQIDPAVQDSYVGDYLIDADTLLAFGLPSHLQVKIRKVGSRLLSELRDMQDELFPESETAFFTDHHYGRFIFCKDERGAVTHLLYCEDGREMLANKVR